MFNESNCDRKSQLSKILTKASNPTGDRDKSVGTWDWAAGTRKWVPESGQQGQ